METLGPTEFPRAYRGGGAVGGGTSVSNWAQGYLPSRPQGKQVSGSSSAPALEGQGMAAEHKDFPMRGGFLEEVAQGVGLSEL